MTSVMQDGSQGIPQQTTPSGPRKHCNPTSAPPPWPCLAARHRLPRSGVPKHVEPSSVALTRVCYDYEVRSTVSRLRRQAAIGSVPASRASKADKRKLRARAAWAVRQPMWLGSISPGNRKDGGAVDSLNPDTKYSRRGAATRAPAAPHTPPAGLRFPKYYFSFLSAAARTVWPQETFVSPPRQPFPLLPPFPLQPSNKKYCPC